MKGPDRDLHPLPRELAEGARALRDLSPPEDLVSRALDALPERRPAAAEPGSDARDRRFPAPLIWGGLAAGAALAAALAVAVPRLGHLSPGVEEYERSEERSMDLPEDGHAWTDLDIWTHHHENQPAVVHVEVPATVRVHLPGEDGGAEERHCVEERCVHRFSHRGAGAPVRVAVARPGRYEINVRHESREARVRETFVLTAMREEND